MFVTRPKADASDRSPLGNFWFGPVPGAGGSIVTGDSAMRLTAVYRAVRLLQDSVSNLPFKLYKRNANGRGRTLVTDHWLHTLFAVKPNNTMDPAVFRKLGQVHLELRGNAYSRIVGDSRGRIIALLPLHPDRVTLELIGDNSWRYRHVTREGKTQYFSREEIFHRKDFTLDGIVGLNPIACAREALSTGLAAQDYGMRFFQNDATPGGWIEYPGEFKDDQSRRSFRESLNALWSGRNKGKVAVLDRGLKYHEVKVNNVDAQFIESKKFTVAEIARLFGVPPHKIGDMSASTNNNIEQQSLDYINDSLLGRVNGWKYAILSDLLGEQAEGLEVEFDLMKLMSGDSAARSRYYHEGIMDGWLTRNEAREAEGHNPLDGLAEPLRPLNMVEEDEAENTSGNTDQPAKPAPQDGEAENAEDAEERERDARRVARFDAMLEAAVNRITRKELEMVRKAHKAEASIAETYAAHVSFVSQALGVPVVDVACYCAEQAAMVEGNRKMNAEDFELITRQRLVRLATECTPS